MLARLPMLLDRLVALRIRVVPLLAPLHARLLALSDQLMVVRDRVVATLDAFLQPPGNDDAFYLALAARREPVFREIAPAVSPWAGRRRAANRNRAGHSEAA